MSARELTGIGVGSQAAVGPVALFIAPDLNGEVPDTVGPKDGAALIKQGLVDVTDALRRGAEQAEVDAARDVLGATAEIASDPELEERLVEAVERGQRPVAAARAVFDEYADDFRAIGEYMAERVPDLLSVRDRLIARLLGVSDSPLGDLAEPSVIVATDLTPADTSALDMSKVLAIVTEEGGATSHTAIIAGQLGLPCVVGVKGAMKLDAGTTVVADGRTGTVHLEPSDELIAMVARRSQAHAAFAEDQAPGATKDGAEIQLLANIGGPDDTATALAAACEGVGLFRTEFLFLSSDEEPSVERQAELYGQVFEAMKGKKVVVRTIDAGSDKPIKYATPTGEANPALGVRAFRLQRHKPGVLERQLEALSLAASRHPDTDVWVMAPMISVVKEAAEFVGMARAAGLKTAGVMIEVPAAAMEAERILAVADFVSLGTNDLAQYTMATDRMSSTLADLLDPWQPAVLKLIANTALAGQRAGKPVGVCGESGSDPLMALFLCGLGMNSLSMSAGKLAEVRYALRHCTKALCQNLVREVLGSPDAESAREAVVRALDPDLRAVLEA